MEIEMKNEEFLEIESENIYWRRYFFNLYSNDLSQFNMKQINLIYNFFMATPCERILKDGADKVFRDCVIAALTERE